MVTHLNAKSLVVGTYIREKSLGFGNKSLGIESLGYTMKAAQSIQIINDQHLSTVVYFSPHISYRNRSSSSNANLNRQATGDEVT